jgi:hypothetical protein
VQLKTRFVEQGNERSNNWLVVNANLEAHVGGCVVLMQWGVNDTSHRAELTYRWHGNGPPRGNEGAPNATRPSYSRHEGG